jgi:hypothetical protein
MYYMVILQVNLWEDTVCPVTAFRAKCARTVICGEGKKTRISRTGKAVALSNPGTISWQTHVA